MREEGVERRLTTILAADVVGYSGLMAADEAGTLASLKAIQSFDRSRRAREYSVSEHMGLSKRTPPTRGVCGIAEVCFVIAPASQELEPPANPGRFTQAKHSLKSLSCASLPFLTWQESLLCLYRGAFPSEVI